MKPCQTSQKESTQERGIFLIFRSKLKTAWVFTSYHGTSLVGAGSAGT
jgi:hypothetical protein